MNLENEFVKYEQTLALRELGFEEPCLGYYIELKNPVEGLLEIGLDNEYLQAPLYQQAFRWFREKYGLWQIVMQNTDKDWTYDIMPIIGMIDYKIFDVFDNYEEAELACLKKLIEIVK
jgi:hypothetical protein